MITRLIALLILSAFYSLFSGCGGSNSSDQTLTLEAVCNNEPSRKQTTKIINGNECQSTNGTVVKLLLLDEEDNQTICSGVRLNSTTILTAAHCLNELVFSVLVELASGERIIPTKIKLHPKFTIQGSLFINDAALLTILPPEGETPPPTVAIAKRIAEGDSLSILGFGVTDGVSQQGSGVLRVGEMQVAEVTTDLIFSDYLSPTQSNTCFGDSGGPAFFEDDSGGLVLAGITSTGTNVRCQVGDRSAFTNITNQVVRDFIGAQ
jgi:secreted trypsin-like serine protease